MINKIKKLLFILTKINKVYFISNSTAYRVLKSQNLFNNDKYSFIFIGEYLDSKKDNNISNFTLPLSAIRFKPYSLNAKFQVLYCDIFQLLFCIIILLTRKKNLEIIFTSVTNSRCLYILDPLVKNLRVIDWQYKYIYRFLLKEFKNRSINFKYGNFIFRANHKLNCKIIFPKSYNDKFYNLINYKNNGNILIIHNPNRSIKYWENINKIIEENKNTKKLFYIIIHPKTFQEDRIDFINIFRKNINIRRILFTSINELINNNQLIDLEICYSLSSSLDFILYDKNIPVTSPLLAN